MAVSPPPKKTTPAKPDEQQKDKRQEKKIEEIINRGSTTVTQAEPQQERIKNFNIKIMSSQLTAIDELRAKRPRKPTSPKLAVSLQDWILEAIEEKIESERIKYNTGL
ncbi:hypothetical protein [Spirosoma koreense]